MTIHEESAITETDYGDKETLEPWLKKQTGDVSMAITVRAALRTFPGLAVEFNRPNAEEKDVCASIALPLFRALAASWIAARYPNNIVELKKHILLAALNVEKILADSNVATSILSATSAAAFASAAFAVMAPPDTVITLVGDSVANEAAAYAALYPARSVPSGIEDALSAINDDVAYLQRKNSSASGLAGKRLWLSGQPELLSELWEQLQERLLSVDEGWDVWIRWYEIRLMGE